MVDPTGRIINQKREDDGEEFCAVTSLFQAIARSKSLQAVHYSGNNINQMTLTKIKKILKIIDGLAYGSGGVIKADSADTMFGNLDGPMDIAKINEIIGSKIKKDDVK